MTIPGPVLRDFPPTVSRSTQDALEGAIADVLAKHTRLTEDGIDEYTVRLLMAIPADALPYKVVPSEGIDPALYHRPEEVAHGLFADVDGKMWLQLPARLTRAECEVDAKHYAKGTTLEVRPLFDGPGVEVTR